jgi:DNA-binding LytR/AlgR family response regulator
MKKIFIVEDEPLIVDTLEIILEEEGYQYSGYADNAFDAITNIGIIKPDMVLLDINLEGKQDGIDLAEKINKLFGIPFIYLTSYSDKAMIERCKNTRPMGYIMKPFTEGEIYAALEIAFGNIEYKENGRTMSEVDKVQDFLFIKDKNSLVKIIINDILFAEADDIYCKLITTKGTFLLSSTLKKLEDKLKNEHFIRVHKSYLVSIPAIERIIDNELRIGTHKIPVGRIYRDLLLKRISPL